MVISRKGYKVVRVKSRRKPTLYHRCSWTFLIVWLQLNPLKYFMEFANGLEAKDSVLPLLWLRFLIPGPETSECCKLGQKLYVNNFIIYECLKLLWHPFRRLSFFLFLPLSPYPTPSSPALSQNVEVARNFQGQPWKGSGFLNGQFGIVAKF